MGSLLLKKGSHCSPHVHPVFFVVSKAEQYVTRRSFYQGRLCEPKSEKKKKSKGSKSCCEECCWSCHNMVESIAEMKAKLDGVLSCIEDIKELNK